MSILDTILPSLWVLRAVKGDMNVTYQEQILSRLLEFKIHTLRLSGIKSEY